MVRNGRTEDVRSCATSSGTVVFVPKIQSVVIASQPFRI